jgi:hypothetical protein
MSYNQFGARGGKFSTAKPKSDVEWAMCGAALPAAAARARVIPLAGCGRRRCPDLEATIRSLIARAAAASSGEGGQPAALFGGNAERDTGTAQYGES